MVRMAFASPFNVLSLESIGSFHVRENDIQFVLSGSFDGNNSQVSFFLLLKFLFFCFLFFVFLLEMMDTWLF